VEQGFRIAQAICLRNSTRLQASAPPIRLIGHQRFRAAPQAASGEKRRMTRYALFRPCILFELVVSYR
jgi:hypothetical protein